MCGNSENTEGWQTDLPDSCGDWLWISQWECGCIRNSGIAFVYGVNKNNLDERPPDLAWESDNGNIFCLGWEGQYPSFLENGPVICYWKKLLLPSPKEYDPKNPLGFNKTFLRYYKR